MNIQQCVQSGMERLASVAEQPALEAEVLLMHVLNCTRTHLHAWPEREVTTLQVSLYEQLIQRRMAREPLAYIVGSKEFWSLDFIVTPQVLVPRPETELIVETVLKLFPNRKDEIDLADLGTGSGAIAVALAHECPNWRIVATDISESALRIASKNAQQNKANNISFLRGSWCTALPDTRFHVIVSNPPYIAETEWDAFAEGLQFEPLQALVSGEDGLDDIKLIVADARRYLHSGGYLLIEHGYLQGANVREIFDLAGYSGSHSLMDLSGQERITVGQYFY